jgi:hypothetical protein
LSTDVDTVVEPLEIPAKQLLRPVRRTPKKPVVAAVWTLLCSPLSGPGKELDQAA